MAIAGKVKAGKSTLLNALVGEQIAPTDAGECTRVVTWYRDAPAPRVRVLPGRRARRAAAAASAATTARSRSTCGACRPSGCDRLVVDWPSQSLRATTLIDTPGIASMSASELAAHAARSSTPDDDTPAEADAVVYLMRHLHAADAEFLESFRDQGVARASAVNTIAVISRADEIGGGRLDAMLSARRIARRYRTEPALRGLCQTVVAVAGLLAQTGRTLRQAEFAALAALAAAPREEMDDVAAVHDRFLRSDEVAALAALPTSGAAAGAVRAVRRAAVHDAHPPGRDRPARAGRGAGAGAAGWTSCSEVLTAQFGERRDLLKARAALLAVDRVLALARRAPTRTTSRQLAAEVERILSGAHEFAELRLLSALRCGEVTLPEAESAAAERLLGGAGRGTRAAARPAGGRPGRTRCGRRRWTELDRWHRRAEDPFADRPAVRAYRAVARTCEGLVAALSTPAVSEV